MCPYCNYDSDDNMIFKDTLINTWYLRVEGSMWDEYNDDWVWEHVYDISYCPFCGRKLD